VAVLKADILIIDGYNIIGAWEELKALKETDMGSARDQLISIFSAYAPWCWERIIIVFDGQEFNWEHFDGVEVVFTGGNNSADTLIENLAAGLSTGSQVEVATSDYAEYRAASALGAWCISASALRERLAEQQNSYRRRLADNKKGRGIMINDILNKSVLDNLQRLRHSEDP